MASPSAASALPISVVVFPAFLGGMGFESLPPLSIISKPFRFLKSLNLNSVGLGLNEVLPEFGWDLILFELILEQYGPKGVQGLSEVQTEVVDVDDDPSLSEGNSDSVHIIGTRSEPVLDPYLKPNPIYEERLADFLDDFSEKVEDIDLGEGPETPLKLFKPRR